MTHTFRTAAARSLFVRSPFVRSMFGTLALCLAATTAQAQTAGTLMARLGAAQIKPVVTSGNLSAPSFAGSQVDLKADTQPEGGLTYMVNNHIAIDVPLTLGFKHDIVGAGTLAGAGRLGEVKALPVTLLVQYRFFDATNSFRPYVGAGPTYAKFYKARSTAALNGLTGGSPANPTTLSVESKFSVSVQAGVSYMFTPNLFVDATVVKTPLKTRATLSTGQTVDVKLDPLTTGLALGYKF
jgi:outer membrane protein